jgi:hypothetical protein
VNSEKRPLEQQERDIKSQLEKVRRLRDSKDRQLNSLQRTVEELENEKEPPPPNISDLEENLQVSLDFNWYIINLT